MLQHDNRNKTNYEMLKALGYDGDINKMYENIKKVNPDFKVRRTYNYMGTRYYNLINEVNDVPVICSNNSIFFSGYTGPAFLIDFDKKIIIIVMSNVMHNTKLSRQERKKRQIR